MYLTFDATYNKDPDFPGMHKIEHADILFFHILNFN